MDNLFNFCLLIRTGRYICNSIAPLYSKDKETLAAFTDNLK